MSVRRLICYVLSSLVVVAAGCSPETIWSAETKSPDGQWIAIGRTDQYSGPGNAAVYTGVFLRRAQGDQSEGTVLLFYDDQPRDSRTAATIEWLTPRHLQVSFSRHVEFDTQVVKYAGIEISVRDFPTGDAANKN